MMYLFIKIALYSKLKNLFLLFSKFLSLNNPKNIILKKEQNHIKSICYKQTTFLKKNQNSATHILIT